MSLGHHFEALAASIWHRLADAERLGVSQGETALTDHLLLELARLNHPHLRVVKTPVNEEDVKGTDWEWWIGTPYSGWLRYAAQAKRVTIRTGRYDQLRHMVGATRQLEILSQYALSNHAIPMYCLYNFYSGVTPAHWHCQRAFDAVQLGCSVAPVSVIDNALDTWGGRTFDAIHRHDHVVPWRCLVRCPRFIGAFVRGPYDIQQAAKGDLQTVVGVEPLVYEALPPRLQRVMESSAQADDAPTVVEADFAFDREYYNANLGTYPRCIAVIDVSGSDDLGSIR